MVMVLVVMLEWSILVLVVTGVGVVVYSLVFIQEWYSRFPFPNASVSFPELWASSISEVKRRPKVI